MTVLLVILGSLLFTLIIGFWGLCAYYRAKYVVGTKNKFRRQIEKILEDNLKIEGGDISIIYSPSLVDELTELISGEKIFKN